MHRSGMPARAFSWCGSGRAGEKLHSRSSTNSQSPHARRKPGHLAFQAVGLSAPLCPSPAPLAVGQGALRPCFTALFFPAKPCRRRRSVDAAGDAMGVRPASLPQLKD